MTNEKPYITDVTVQFMQDGDERTCEHQTLTVAANWTGDGHYLSISTERWSADAPSEIMELLAKVLEIAKQ